MASKAEQAEQEARQRGPLGKVVVFLKTLGPGLVTGASDDDPSGIGTYSQTGAQFGYSQLWLSLFTFPLMTVVQEICARIALQTGAGLAETIRKHYPKPVLYFCILLLTVANTINIGADLGAMAASAQLLVNIPFVALLAGMTIFIVLLQVFVAYNQYTKILRLLTFSLFTYVVVVFVVPQDWGQALRSTLIPSFQFERGYILNIVAILGTTISPYLYFWQASHEVEEQIDEGKTTPASRRGTTRTELKWMRADVTAGMFLSNVIMWFIIATTASTLYVNGIREIDSAPKAAEALKPVAGQFAAVLFAAGIIGTGLLAVPVLAGSAAYAIAETFKLREGLYLKLRQAPGFYGAIVLATAVGAAINFVGINPIQALYWAAIINGIIAPPLLVMLLLISNNEKIMHDKRNGRWSNVLGWLTMALMTLAAVASIVSLVLGS